MLKLNREDYFQATLKTITLAPSTWLTKLMIQNDELNRGDYFQATFKTATLTPSTWPINLMI